jgi:hypothetical protein
LEEEGVDENFAFTGASTGCGKPELEEEGVCENFGEPWAFLP